MKAIKLLIVILCMGLFSCSDFLEEYSTDLKYCESADDLNKVMIGEAFVNWVGTSIYSQATMSGLESETDITLPWLHVMDDDSEVFPVDFVSTDQKTPLYMLASLHYWMANPFVDVLNMTWDDMAWKKLYKYLGAVNAVIYQGELLYEDPTKRDDLLKHVLGEAYFLRGYYYFILNNIYGAPYCVATASSDEGVPLKVSETVDDNYFVRTKNNIIYNQIVEDLNNAAKYLDAYTPDSKIHIGIGAVRALQSRVYLYMERYDDAIAAAKLVESMDYKLNDLNSYVDKSNVVYRSSEETIFTMGCNEIPMVFINDSLSAWNGDDNRASSFRVSDDLISLYDPNDLRLKCFFKRSSKTKSWLPEKYKTWSLYNDPEQVSCLFFFRLAEVYLNHAEALAMKGNDGEAKTTLQILRDYRYASSSISSLPSDNETLVNYIRDERRRELCFEGHRWFDLRRYAVNSKYPLSDSFSIKHPVYSYDEQSNTHSRNGYYELQSFNNDKAAWQIPIPNYAIEFNRGSLTNPLRSTRNIKH